MYIPKDFRYYSYIDNTPTQGIEMNKIGNVPVQNLTHVFRWNDKECLVGKFDLAANPAVLLDVPMAALGTELMEQIDASGVFTLEELENIAMLSGETFLSLITEQ